MATDAERIITMTINYEMKKIEMTKAESKEAGNPTSAKLEELMKLRSIFPDFEIIIKKTSVKRDTYKGLGYEYMENYIKSHDNSDANLKEFYKLRGMNEKGEKDVLIEEHSYGEIKMWFLSTFPEIEEFNAETNKKLKDIKAKRAEARKVA